MTSSSVKPASSPIEGTGRRALLATALAALLCACAATAPVDDIRATVRAVVAPTGTLRIAVYPGSPTSLLEGPGPGEQRGLSVDIGLELARRLGVPAQVLVYPRVAEVVAALKRGEADITVTNATDERKKDLDFCQPLLALELGVLVPPGSPITAVDAIDRPGARIGVSQGSSSHRAMSARLRQATLVPMASLQAAGAALRAGQLDAFATNKSILYEMASDVPGARLLDGRWGLEHVALATRQGRDVALPALRLFSAAMLSEGHVERAVQRAGLRGTAPADVQ